MDESPGHSALQGRVVFVLAPPHSGAEHLLAALGSLPGVALMSNGRLFHLGVVMVLRTFHLKEGLGSSVLASWPDFIAAVRRLVDALFAACLRRKGCRRIVEYSPDHVLTARALRTVYPDAFFVHLLRDPRRSAAEAFRESGTARSASARAWAAAHRAAGELVDSPRLYRLRFEQLVRHAEEELAALTSFLRIEASQQELEASVRAFTDAHGEAAPCPPLRGFRARVVSCEAGPELERLGYARSTDRPGPLSRACLLAVERAMAPLGRLGVSRVA